MFQESNPTFIDVIPGRRYSFTYQNYRGETSERYVEFDKLQYGFDGEYYTEPELMLRCLDLERHAARTFAVSRIADGTFKEVL